MLNAHRKACVYLNSLLNIQNGDTGGHLAQLVLCVFLEAAQPGYMLILVASLECPWLLAQIGRLHPPLHRLNYVILEKL
jgi:hypothetical protein